MADVCVVGDSLPALAAALDLAEVGIRVHIVATGGAPWPDQGARDPDGALGALLARVAEPIAPGGPIAEDARPESALPPRLLLPNKRGEWSPVPDPSVFGIPAVPMSKESLAFLKGGAAFRAYLDRLKPLLTVGKTHELGRLVSTRMGDAVLERLVEPIVRERYGVADVEAAIAAPGLNEALTLAGSLSGAVLAYSERHVARETLVAPRGGWQRFRALLLERLGHYGASVLTEPVEISSAESGWLVRSSAGESAVDAVVVDTEASSGELAEALGALAPKRVRVRAAVPVAGAEAPGGGADFLRDGAEALQTVSLADGTDWSVRLRVSDANPVAVVSGPALPEARVDEGWIIQALSEAGVAAGAEFAVTAVAAPFGSIAEREAAQLQLQAEREAEATLLAVGVSLFGDDLSTAVGDAREAAVALRRRLTGIADSQR